jgi:hypothetical protein
MSVRLALIQDDTELGTALTRIAALYFQAGNITQGMQTRVDAEECYARAERSSARLSMEDQKVAARSIDMLRSAIDLLSTTKCYKQSDLTAMDFQHVIC